jgi:folate-binding protein YgfZ
MSIDVYKYVRDGGGGFYEHKRGLISVWGTEAIPFLDGMVTNDIKTLEDGAQLLAAFPNAKGRLLALVRILRHGNRYFIETEESTREWLFNNLFRFTFAGDFFVEDISSAFECFHVINFPSVVQDNALRFAGRGFDTFALPHGEKPNDKGKHEDVAEIPPEVYEILRVESGVPRYGVDIDENTIVPEIGTEGLISYSKGCYIGQEIIARIHFRGHVAKHLMGLTFEPIEPGGHELLGPIITKDGKDGGKATSAVFSPMLNQHIALGFVRYDHLDKGTDLYVNGHPAKVTSLPFIE